MGVELGWGETLGEGLDEAAGVLDEAAGVLDGAATGVLDEAEVDAAADEDEGNDPALAS